MVTIYKVPVFRSNADQKYDDIQIPNVESYLQALVDMGVLTAFSGLRGGGRVGGKGPIPYEFSLTYNVNFSDSPVEARIDRTLQERFEAVRLNVPWYHKV